MSDNLSERKPAFIEPTFADMAADPIFLQYWDSQGITSNDIGQLLQEAAQRLKDAKQPASVC